MNTWRKSCVSENEPLRHALELLNVSQICLVVDGDDRLLGTVTDGDVRRAILAGMTLDQPVERIMQRSPRVANSRMARTEMVEIMTSLELRHLPVVDDGGRVVGLAALDKILAGTARPNWVVVMAGGLGTRLRPLTETVPKPLLPVGGRPVLEIIIGNLIAQDLRHIYLSVNYKADMVKDYFGDGSRWGASIRYLEEDTALGTAGALGLLPDRPEAPLLVMNGDLITKVDFGHLLAFHREQKTLATMAVREFDLQVPYGVVQIADGVVGAIEEKPVHRFFVNAGLYVLEPDVLDLLPANQRIDMTDLLSSAMTGGKVAAFPIREYWLDIGRHEDLARAHAEYGESFE